MATRLVIAITAVFSLLCMLSINGAAAQPQFEKWGIAPGPESASMVAGTLNDSGQILAQGCWFDTGDCVWMIGLDVACIKGQQGQVLVNPIAAVERSC